MINSHDNGYFFLSKSFNKEITGNIIDRKNKIKHNYSLRNNNINNSIRFEYLNSSLDEKHEIPCYDKDNLFEIIKIPLDNVNTNFKVIKYKNYKKKRVIQSSDIKVIQSEIPVFSLIITFFLSFCLLSKTRFTRKLHTHFS